jgi:uncharacterized protein YggL (DUF469 family)
MAWGEPNNAAWQTSTPQQQFTRDQLLALWREASENLKAVKANELNLRNLILEREFKGKPEGTHNIELGNGWKLKAQLKTNYSLDKDTDKVNAAIDELIKQGNEGQFIADRLISWKPEISVKEYKLLGDAYKKIIDTVLTTKPGQGSIEIVEPKTK